MVVVVVYNNTPLSFTGFDTVGWASGRASSL